MQSELLTLDHEQQQQAVEEIQQLMRTGMSSGEAIALVAQKLRDAHHQSHTEKQ